MQIVNHLVSLPRGATVEVSGTGGPRDEAIAPIQPITAQMDHARMGHAQEVLARREAAPSLERVAGLREANAIAAYQSQVASEEDAYLRQVFGVDLYA